MTGRAWLANVGKFMTPVVTAARARMADTRIAKELRKGGLAARLDAGFAEQVKTAYGTQGVGTVQDTYEAAVAAGQAVDIGMTEGLRAPMLLGERLAPDFATSMLHGKPAKGPSRFITIKSLFGSIGGIHEDVQLLLARNNGPKELMATVLGKRKTITTTSPDTNWTPIIASSQFTYSVEVRHSDLLEAVEGGFFVARFPRLIVSHQGWSASVQVKVRIPADDFPLLRRELHGGGRGLFYMRQMAQGVIRELMETRQFDRDHDNRLTLNLTRDQSEITRVKGDRRIAYLKVSLPLDRDVGLIGDDSTNDVRIRSLHAWAIVKD